MGKEALSSAFSQMILEEAKKDKDIVVVCTDSRGSAKLGAYPDELPEQFVEMGIAEQNSVTVSAGMAYMGKKVFTIGPASFYSMRSAEQVKVDVAYMDGWTIWRDIKILLKTIKVVVMKDGAK